MADVKVAPSEQWSEPEEARAAAQPRRGYLVADGDGYIVSTSGPPDAFFADDGDGVQVDPSAAAATGRRITVVAGKARIEGD